MFKISQISLLLFAICISGKSQKKITIDFKRTGYTAPSLDDIKKGDYYQVVVDNINLNLYKVSLTAADTIVSKPQATPTFGLLDFDALSKLTAGIAPLSTAISGPAFQNFQKNFSLLQGQSDFTIAVANNNAAIVNRMDAEKVLMDKAKKNVEAEVKKIDDIKLEVYKLRLNASLETNPSAAYNWASALAAIIQVRAAIALEQKNIEAAQSSYEDFSTKYKAAIEKDSDLKKNDQAIKDAYDKFTTALTDIFTSISADKINDLLSTVVFLENNKNNTFVSLPIQFLGEQAKVQVNITPRDDKSLLQSYTMPITFPAKVRPYTVVGISLYGSTLRDEAYGSIKTKVNDSTYNYNYKNENTPNGELGVAALLRFGSKFAKSDFGAHFSFGAGLSVGNKIKPRILAGGGFTYGGRHMLAIDMGAIAGYVDRLGKNIDLSIPYTEKPDNIMVSRISFGLFGSLGYIYQF